jgi:hypothetical protein
MGLVKVNLGALYIRQCKAQTDEYNIYSSVSGIDEYILK